MMPGGAVGLRIDEITSAASRAGIQGSILNRRATETLFNQLVNLFGTPGSSRPLWEMLTDGFGVQNADGWAWPSEFTASRPCIILFDPKEEVVAFELTDGAELVTLLADCTGFEFYVTNKSTRYLLSFNHHDFLVAAGEAKEWLRLKIGLPLF